MIIGSLDKQFSSDIIATMDLWRVVLVIVHSSTWHMHPSTLDPVDDGAEGDVKVDDGIELNPLKQSLCLGHCPGEAIQEPGVLHLLDRVENERHHRLVWNELALGDVVLSLSAEGGLLGDVSTEEISTGEVLEAKGRGNPRRNSPLAGSWGTHDDCSQHVGHWGWYRE